MTLDEIVAALKAKFGAAVTDHVTFRDEQSLTVTLDKLHALMAHARDELGFDYLVDVSSVDHMGEEPRFEMVYELYGYGHGRHLRVKAKVSEEESAPTVSDLWPTADWHEREVYDMMGIDFAGHPDLRRILDVGRLSVLPLAERFPAGRQTQRDARRGVHRHRTAGRWSVRDECRGDDTIAREPRARRV
jgi:NADH-quinone oxidoreductase subunit C